MGGEDTMKRVALEEAFLHPVLKNTSNVLELPMW